MRPFKGRIIIYYIYHMWTVSDYTKRKKKKKE